MSTRSLLLCFTLLNLSLFPDDPSLVPAPQSEVQSEKEALALRRIADFWEEGEYAIAKQQIEEFLSTYPETSFISPLYAALGNLSLQDKDPSSALSFYAKVTDPALLPHTFLNRMRCLYLLEQYAKLADECETFFETLDLDSETKLQMTYYLAIALHKQSLLETQDPKVLASLAEKARPHLEQLDPSAMSQEKEMAESFAYLLCALKEFPKASLIYLELAKNNPQQKEELFFQAATIQAEYNKKEARQTFREIASLGGSHAKEASFNEMVLAFEEGAYQELVDKKIEFLQSIPPDQIGHAHLFIGRSLIALGRFADGCREIVRYLDFTSSPSDPTTQKEETLHFAIFTLAEAAFQGSDLNALDIALEKIETAYPQDPERPKMLLYRALLYQQEGKGTEARTALQTVLDLSPSPAIAASALFELAYLDAKEGQWVSCQERSRTFLSQFSDHDLVPHIRRYLLTASLELTRSRGTEDPTALAHFASLLEEFLSCRYFSSIEEEAAWQLLLAKTTFEMGQYDKTLQTLGQLTLATLPPQEEGNLDLLRALCYRDGNQDLLRFCEYGEHALAKHTDWIDPSALHASLFNAYSSLLKEENRERDEGEEKTLDWLANAEEHLFAAFAAHVELSKENISWLADRYWNLWKGNRNEDRNLAERTAQLCEYILSSLVPRPNNDLQNPPVELIDPELLLLRLAELKSFLGKPEEGIAALESLLTKYQTSPTSNWRCQEEALLRLGEIHAALGHFEEALQHFETVGDSPPSLRTWVGASAALQSAKLRGEKWKSDKEEQSLDPILARLERLMLQKTMVQEPCYLEAALEYIDLKSFGQPVEKRLSLMVQIKKDFEAQDDIPSKDYHQARAHLPEKDQIYHHYMLFLEANILSLQSMLSSTRQEQKELQAKAKDLLLKIIEEKAHPALLARVHQQL